MRQIFEIVIAVFLVFLLPVCGDSSGNASAKTISASACAKRTPDGRKEKCKVTADMEKDLTENIKKYEEIDRKYPGPKWPNVLKLQNESLFDLKHISEDGIFLLENGKMLALAGLKCSGPELLKDLAAEFQDRKSSKVFYRPSGYVVNGITYAYVWVTKLTPRDPLIRGQVNSINETALTSGWCKPIEQKGHKYYERYKALASMSEHSQ